MAPPDEVAEEVALSFRAAYLDDRSAGSARSLAEYLEESPREYWELVAREFVTLSAAEDPSGVATAGDERAPSASGSSRHIGCYRIERELGRGGQATVYLAEDSRLHRQVALKVLEGRRGRLSIERLRREAEVTSQLDHPGICTVYEAGIDEGAPFIAMQYVEGETLDRSISTCRESADTTEFGTAADETGEQDAESEGSLRDSPILSRDQVLARVALVEKVARALHAAHEQGVLHRDVKPANVMINAAGEPILMDFGLARQEDSDAPTLTHSGDLFGTPNYLSPEQLTRQSISVDRRSDVWALGVMLYECLTLQRPFQGPTREALYEAILTREPEGPRRRNPHISKDLAVVVETALQKERGRRYQTALDLAEDLRRVLESRPILARRISAFGRFARWARRRPASAALLVAALIGLPLIAALGGYIVANLPDILAQREAVLAAEGERALERGFMQLHHGTAIEADRAFARALEGGQVTAEAAAGLALAKLKLRQPQAALEALELAETSLSDPGILLWIKADVLEALGRAQSTREARAAAPKPSGPLSWFLAGVREIDRGEVARDGTAAGREAFQRARDYLIQAVQSSEHARRAYHFELAHAIGHLGEREEALRLAESLAALWPDSGACWYWIGFACARVDPERSISAYRESIRLDPDRVEALINLGIALRARGALDEALACYRDALRIDPDLALVHNNIGNALAARGDHEQAIAAYLEATRLDPGYADAHCNLAGTLRELKRTDAAIAACHEVLRLEPHHARALNELGGLLLERGETDAASALLRRAIGSDPRCADARGNLGIALMSQGKAVAAIASFREALRIDPDHHLVHNDLGVALKSQGRIDEAIASYREALRIEPDHAAAHINLGIALREKGEVEAAAESLRRAILLDPDSAEARNSLGILLAGQGDVDGAIRSYRDALRVRPDYAMALSNLGNALASRGDIAEAIAAYRDAIRIEPAFANAHYCLASVLQERGEDRAAIASYREAIRHQPDHAEARYNLGGLLHRHGELEEAVEHLRRGHVLGTARGPRWAYPSARGLESATLEWVEELEDNGETKRALAILEEVGRILPESRRISRALAERNSGR